MYKEQLLKDCAIYDLKLVSKEEFNELLKKPITKQEKTKQLKDKLNEIEEKIKTLNNKINDLNKKKDEWIKLIEKK